MSWKFTGSTAMANRLERFRRRVPRFLEQASRAEFEKELKEMKRVVPLDTGDLESTGRVETTRDGGGVVSTVIFGDPSMGVNYAVVQHEDLTLNHKNGRQAKYIESTLKESAPFMKARISFRYSTFLGQSFMRG